MQRGILTGIEPHLSSRFSDFEYEAFDIMGKGFDFLDNRPVRLDGDTQPDDVLVVVDQFNF